MSSSTKVLKSGLLKQSDMNSKKVFWIVVLFCSLATIAVLVVVNAIDVVEPKPAIAASVVVPARSDSARAMDVKLYSEHQRWVGTAWEFSGTSQVPGEGAIACGYFVTTTLRDVGVEIDRIRLAQAASETMILEVTDQDSVRRYSDASLERVLTTIRNQGEGYYIVGLDNHTGFLKVDANGDVMFIHSGPGKGVVIEAPRDSQKLSASRYRVTGKIEWGS